MATVPDETQLFDAVPDACLVLDRDLVMVRANPAYLAMAEKTPEELLGHRVQDVFPVNPADPAAAERLEEAYRRVLRTGQTYPMGVIRYDFPTTEPTMFEPRYWSVTLNPVHSSASTPFRPVVDFVLHRARDVTAVHTDLLRALELLRRDAGPDSDRDNALLDLETTSARTTTLTAALTAEVEQMQAAMDSRAAIEQAKGVVMRDRACTADAAFAVLRELSQHSNRKLRDVAAAVLSTVTEITDDAVGRP